MCQYSGAPSGLEKVTNHRHESGRSYATFAQEDRYIMLTKFVFQQDLGDISVSQNMSSYQAFLCCRRYFEILLIEFIVLY